MIRLPPLTRRQRLLSPISPFVQPPVVQHIAREDILVEDAITETPLVMVEKISRNPSNWTKICHNSFILRIVNTGYKLQFNADSILPQSVISVPSDKFQKIAIQCKISKFLAIGAIFCVPKSPTNLLSRVFCVKKANGEDRLILDLSKLNEQIVKVSFEMEG